MKSVIIILAMLVASVFSDLNDPLCGTSPKSGVQSLKVVGGKPATHGHWGWIGELQRSGSLTCGGSIIDKANFITAAHCITVSACSTYTVRLGHHTRTPLSAVESTMISRTVQRCTNNPAYNSGNFQNDGSVLRFTIPIEYNAPFIIPVCFPPSGFNHEDTIDNTHVAGTTNVCQLISWAAGWGTMSSGGLAIVNQEVDLCVTTHADCTAYYGATCHKLTMVGAGTRGDGKDTCQGDSGGPLVVKESDGKWNLIGLTSWGRGCGDIGVYAKVSALRSWVEQVIGATA